MVPGTERGGGAIGGHASVTGPVTTLLDTVLPPWTVNEFVCPTPTGGLAGDMIGGTVQPEGDVRHVLEIHVLHRDQEIKTSTVECRDGLSAGDVPENAVFQVQPLGIPFCTGDVDPHRTAIEDAALENDAMLGTLDGGNRLPSKHAALDHAGPHARFLPPNTDLPTDNLDVFGETVTGQRVDTQ